MQGFTYCTLHEILCQIQIIPKRNITYGLPNPCISSQFHDEAINSKSICRVVMQPHPRLFRDVCSLNLHGKMPARHKYLMLEIKMVAACDKPAMKYSKFGLIWAVQICSVSAILKIALLKSGSLKWCTVLCHVYLSTQIQPISNVFITWGGTKIL